MKQVYFILLLCCFSLFAYSVSNDIDNIGDFLSEEDCMRIDSLFTLYSLVTIDSVLDNSTQEQPSRSSIDYSYQTTFYIAQNPNCKLDVAGTIRANEIIVNTTGADFVFAEDYQLRPLSEVKSFIQKNKHLPEIKSAQEMQENGVSVSELQTKLLQKIEELTLYILQQEQQIQELRQEVEQLKK